TNQGQMSLVTTFCRQYKAHLYDSMKGKLHCSYCHTIAYHQKQRPMQPKCCSQLRHCSPRYKVLRLRSLQSRSLQKDTRCSTTDLPRVAVNSCLRVAGQRNLQERLCRHFGSPPESAAGTLHW